MVRTAAYRNPRIWLLSLGAWVVLGALNAGSEVIDEITGDASVEYWKPITWELTSTLAIALLAPFVIEFALRVRLSTVGVSRAVVAHLGASVVFSVLHVSGMVGLRKVVYRSVGEQYVFGHLAWELLYEGFKDVITYGTIIGLTYGVDYYMKYRERELQASRLQTDLARARLDHLEQRIQPHFLFNTLNMISATMHEDVELAELPQFYADMHGWESIVDTVAGVYHSLPPEQQQHAAIFTFNYGDAGAVDYYGRAHGLPRAIGGHNNYWLWGPGEHSGEVVIVLGDDREGLEQRFDHVELGAVVDCGLCMPYENDTPVWIARDLRRPLSEIWPTVKRYD